MKEKILPLVTVILSLPVPPSRLCILSLAHFLVSDGQEGQLRQEDLHRNFEKRIGEHFFGLWMAFI